MEPLFKTTTDYTPEVLERMNRKVLMKSKPFITAITIMAVLIVLFTAAWVHKIGAASIILGLILAAVFGGTLYFSIKSAIKKTYAFMQLICFMWLFLFNIYFERIGIKNEKVCYCIRSRNHKFKSYYF